MLCANVFIDWNCFSVSGVAHGPKQLLLWSDTPFCTFTERFYFNQFSLLSACRMSWFSISVCRCLFLQRLWKLPVGWITLWPCAEPSPDGQIESGNIQYKKSSLDPLQKVPNISMDKVIKIWLGFRTILREKNIS